MGAYLDIDKGLRLTVSSWQRIDDNAIPARAKVIGSYVNAALASDDARQKGFDEALMLTGDGHLAEASSSNVFLVAGETLYTPSASDDILVGITRAAVLELAVELGLRVHEANIDRSQILAADEVFLCGTGVQVAPVTEIDGRVIGTGKPGRITMLLQNRYLEVMRGEVATTHRGAPPYTTATECKTRAGGARTGHRSEPQNCSRSPCRCCGRSSPGSASRHRAGPCWCTSSTRTASRAGVRHRRWTTRTTCRKRRARRSRSGWSTRCRSRWPHQPGSGRSCRGDAPDPR